MGFALAEGRCVNWGGFAEFAAMGGYGLYVWGSYLVTALVIAIEIRVLVIRHRSAKRQLQND
jgi:heme exporter protein D